MSKGFESGSIMRDIVFDKLMGPKMGKSPGHDGLVLMKVAAKAVEALVKIIQNSINFERGPMVLKDVNVMPLFKQRERQEVGNY
eukprot:g32538.t1